MKRNASWLRAIRKNCRTPEELAVLRDHFRRKAAETAPRMKVNAATISPDHPNEAIGSILLAACRT